MSDVEGRARALILGGRGQVGQALQRLVWPDVGPGMGRDAMECVFLSHDLLDIADVQAVERVLHENRPDVVINAAAYTQVDKAQHDVAGAFAVNALGPANLAQAVKAVDAALIHLSTDCVFDGAKTQPYVEDDPVSPLSVYGASKLAGELAVRSSGSRAVIIRTAWLLGAGETNFLTAILKRLQVGEVLSVMNDQTGSPTAVDDLALVVAQVAQRLVRDPAAPTGVYHYAGAGQATRHDLAVEIASAYAALSGQAVPDAQIRAPDHTSIYRPKNARLNSDAIARDYGAVSQDWKLMVRDLVAKRLARGAGE